MHALVVADTTDMPREEWLALRRHGIGGSDIPAILGLSPWQTAFQLYLEKIGELPGRDENEAMYWGRRLEAVVAEEFSARHPDLRVVKSEVMVRHPAHEWAFANVDRFIVDHPLALEPSAVLEIKTVSEHRRSDWQDGQVPYHVQAQVQWYLWVTGLERAWVAALIGGQRYVETELRRDDEAISLIVERAEAFWRQVQERRPPEPDGSEAAAEVLRRMYPAEEPGKQILLPLEAEDLIRQYEEAKAAKAEAERRQREAENRLKAMLGDAEVGLVAGQPRIRYATVTRKGYTVPESSYRVLKVIGGAES